MPRYFILQGATGTWAVLDTKLTEYPRHVCRGTQAEAEVCAFALNAVVDGYSLGRVKMPATIHADQLSDYYESYDGPAEGIAP